MTDQARDRAISRIRALLAARPELRPTLEALYAKAWPETLILLAALPAPQDWPSAGDFAKSADSAKTPAKTAGSRGEPRPWSPKASTTARQEVA